MLVSDGGVQNLALSEAPVLSVEGSVEFEKERRRLSEAAARRRSCGAEDEEWQLSEQEVIDAMSQPKL